MVSITAKVSTLKFPTSHPYTGFVPPVLKMNERAAPPGEVDELGSCPKGYVTVSMLLETEQVALALIRDVVRGETTTGFMVHGPVKRVIFSGKVIVICELLGRDVAGVTVT